MIDTHCHLDLPIFDGDRREVLARARRAGVRRCVMPGVTLQGFSALTALASPELPVALGLHPWYLSRHPADALERLEGWIATSRPVAIGEIGLDHCVAEESHAPQWRLFTGQLELARKFRLPVLLHVRGAHDQVWSLLRRTGFDGGGIVHAFNGSIQQGQRYLELGFGLGFGGVMTYARALRIRKAAAFLPDEALVLETDAPDLPPEGHAGERNEPAHLLQVARTLAGLRGVALERIVELTTRNATRILNLSTEETA